MEAPSGHDLHALLAETRWVRQLAGTLVNDPHDADDLAQEVSAVALGRPPARATNLRAWLRVVMQSLVLQRVRSSRRRSRREEIAGQLARTVDAAADELAERAAVQRAVVDAILALPKDQRDVVLLRHFEDQPPRVIAARLGIPVATVHSRIQRAYARLRQTLDSWGGRRRWLQALLPLAPLAPRVGALTSCFTAMNLKFSVAGAVLLVGTAAFLFSHDERQPQAVPQTFVSSVTAPPVPQTPTAGVSTDANERTAAVADVGEPVPSAAMRVAAGSLVDAEGRPLPDQRIRVGSMSTSSDATGAFTFRTSEFDAMSASAAEPGWRTVMEGLVRAGEAPPPVMVVAAPAIRLGGQVRSSRGDVPVGVRMRVVLPEGLRARLSGIGDHSAEVAFEARPGEDGAFHLEAAAVRGAELLTIGDGCAPDRRPLPQRDEPGLSIVLERLEGMQGSVRGQVVDLHGRAVAGARVGLGSSMTMSDDAGNFVLADDGAGGELCASAVGHRRAAVAREQGFASFVVLTLGPEPLQIRGRVVDDQGEGIADAAVWVTDPTSLCSSRETVLVEGIALGYPTMAELHERFTRGEFAGMQPDEVLRSNPTMAWPWVRTAADGSFTLGGLEQRSYSLRAMVRDTLQLVERGNVPAGSGDVRLVVDRAGLFDEVAGVLESRTGDPVAGVRVTLMVDALRVGRSTTHAGGVTSVVSDERGRFSLSRVPRQHAFLRLDGDAILPLEPGRGLAGGLAELAGGRPDALRIVVPMRVHVQVELLDPTAADCLSVIDEAGECVLLNVFRNGGRRSSRNLRLEEGRSPVFVVPDAGLTLLLHKGDAEVGRHALQLRAGEVNTLRL